MDERLAAALALNHPTERKLAVVALIDEHAQRLGFRAIVIGGLAVEFWTHGAYATSDIDLYLPHGPAVDDFFAELGFEKRGRHWVHEAAGLFIEAPASFPAADEEVARCRLRVDRPFSFVRRRTCSFIGWRSSSERVTATQPNRGSRCSHLLTSTQRGRRGGQRMKDFSRRWPRSRRSPSGYAGGERLETYELHEVAERLRAQR